MMDSGSIPAALAHKVLLQFDEAVNEALAARTRNRVIFRADKLSTYSFCDGVWTFLLKVRSNPNCCRR